MALGALISPTFRRSALAFGEAPRPTVPVSIMSDWLDVCTSLLVANNGGSTVLAPYGITTATLFPFAMQGAATSFLARMAYDSAKAVSTSPVIQFFGFEGSGLDTFGMTTQEPMQLVNIAGTHACTFDDDTTIDVQFTDGSIVWAYSMWQQFDAMGCYFVLPTVKTAAVQASSGVPKLQVKLI